MDRVILVFVGCWIPLTTNAVTLNRTYPQPQTVKDEPILPIFVPGIFGEIYNSALGRSRDPVIVTKGKDIPKLGSAPSNEANEFKFETSTQRSPGFEAFSDTNFSSKINDYNLTQGIKFYTNSYNLCQIQGHKVRRDKGCNDNDIAGH